MTIRYTLLSEGSSDLALLPILDWLLKSVVTDEAIDRRWADLGRFPKPPRGLENQIPFVVDQFPCDLLFIHRDADRCTRDDRVKEIVTAIEQTPSATVSAICVIPVRMTETWLLFDEPAIRYAADNPNGAMPLDRPSVRTAEEIPNPKTMLRHLLITASGLSGRHLKRFDMSGRSTLVARYTDDYSHLRELSAFQALEQDVREWVDRNR